MTTTTDDHHKVCLTFDDLEQVCLTIVIGHRADGSLSTTVRFPDGERLAAEAGDPDLGFTEPDTVLHDVAHTLLAARLGLERSPVLERVVDLRPLSQEQVDLEEVAAFAIQAWCASLRGESHQPALANVRAALERLPEHAGFEAAPYDHGFRIAPRAVIFPTLEQAQAWATKHAHENGRTVSHLGRAVSDITWRVRDLETNEYHPAWPDEDGAAAIGHVA